MTDSSANVTPPQFCREAYDKLTQWRTLRGPVLSPGEAREFLVGLPELFPEPYPNSHLRPGLETLLFPPEDSVKTFHGAQDPLSNFWVSSQPITFKGSPWPSREHLYQATKLVAHNTTKRHHSLQGLARQWRDKTPAEVKALVKAQIKSPTQEWLSNRLECMRRLVFAWALADKNVLLAVLQPEVSEFIHTLPPGRVDTFWSSSGPRGSKGQNQLGLLILQIRVLLCEMATLLREFLQSPYLRAGFTQKPLHPKVPLFWLPDRLSFFKRFSYRPGTVVPAGTNLNDYLSRQEFTLGLHAKDPVEGPLCTDVRLVDSSSREDSPGTAQALAPQERVSCPTPLPL